MTRPTHRPIAHGTSIVSPDAEGSVTGLGRPSSPSRLAALHALSTGSSYHAAGTLHGVSRQAVAQAIRRLASTPRRPGPKPGERRRQLSVRLADGEIAKVSLTAAQREAFERAAGEAGIGSWLRHLARRARRRAGESTSAWLARIGDVAADRAVR